MEGKVVLVTGGGQGIGKSYCRELLKNGAKVMICDIDEAKAKESVQELQNEFGKDKLDYSICDVTDVDKFEDCFKETIEKFGKLDILINNAGVCNETERGWRKMIEINFNGVVQGTKLGFKYMSCDGGKNCKGGLIVNIASITSLEPWDEIPVYSATKAAVNQFSRSYGTELHFKESGVKVIAVNPGLTATKILNDVKDLGLLQANMNFPQVLRGHPIQRVENMGRGLVQVIKTASNGSLWTIEEDKPPHPTLIK